MKRTEKLTKNTLHILSLAHSLLLFEGLYLMAAGILDMNGMDGSRYPIQGLLTILPVAVSFLCMRKVNNIWLYLLSGGVMTVLMWKITGLPFSGVVTAFIFLVRCYARVVRGRIRRQAEEMPGRDDALVIPELRDIRIFLDSPRVLQWIFFGVFYVGIIATGQITYLKPMFWVFVLEIFVCFAYGYLENQYAFIEENQKISNLPVQTIRRVGKAVFVVMIAVLALFVLPSVIYGKEPLANLPSMEHRVEGTGSHVQTSGNRMGDILLKLQSETEPAPVWLTELLRIAGILVEVFIALVVIFFVICFVRNLMRSYGAPEEDEIIFLGREKEDQISRAKGDRGGKKEGYWSPNQKIRRIYKKTIEKGLAKKPKGSETPRELEQAADLNNPDESFHELYEKARYSEKGCSAQEAAGYQR